MTLDEKYQKLTDDELIKLTRNGDEDAVEFLIRKYNNMIAIRANLYYMVGADKDDIIQEGMIGLFKAIGGYNPDSEASFKTFADLCIKRQMITAIKRADRMKHKPLNKYTSIYDKNDDDDKNAMSFEETYIYPNEYDPESELLFNEQIEHIQKNSEKLFSGLEMKVWNEYLKGKTYTEIAVILDKTPKAIDNAIQRMKKKIETELKLL